MMKNVFFCNNPSEFSIIQQKGFTMNTLPNDPVILLSAVNMKLRDFYPTLDALCEDLGENKDELTKKLASIDYEYDAFTNQFI